MRNSHLVHDHVLELLVENGASEDVVHQRLPTSPRREHVFPHVAVAAFHQSLLHGRGRVGRKGVIAITDIAKRSC